jgi:hypothetical protein
MLSLRPALLNGLLCFVSGAYCCNNNELNEAASYDRMLTSAALPHHDLHPDARQLPSYGLTDMPERLLVRSLGSPKSLTPHPQ